MRRINGKSWWMKIYEAPVSAKYCLISRAVPAAPGLAIEVPIGIK